MSIDHLFSDLLPEPTPIHRAVEQVLPSLIRTPSHHPSSPAYPRAAALPSGLPPWRSNPWQRAGTTLLAEATTDPDIAIRKAGLNWDVQPIEMRTADTLDPVPDVRAIRRTDTKEILGVVGPEYTPFQNRQPSWEGPFYTTTNCAFAAFRTVLRWATMHGWMTDVSYRNIHKLREIRNAREKAWWTIAEVDTALRCAGEVDLELCRNGEKENKGAATLLIALGCLLGLRYGEIIMLRWKDLDLDAIDVTTGASAPVAHIVARDGWTPKDGQSRSVPIHDRLAGILRVYRRVEGSVLVPQKVMPKRGGTKRVYLYDPKKVWNMVLVKAIAAGAKMITPHGMRHSFASNLLMGGATDTMVARWLGHADTSMVHQTYGHLLAYHGDINRMRFTGIPPTGLPVKPE